MPTFTLRSRFLVTALALLLFTACDDGGTKNGDVCGDSVVAATEDCDDGNVDDGDGCAADCTLEAGFTCDNAPGGASTCTPDAPSCNVCACEMIVPDGGCAEICNGVGGGGVPFCAGAPAGVMCAQCIAESCGESTPDLCR